MFADAGRGAGAGCALLSNAGVRSREPSGERLGVASVGGLGAPVLVSRLVGGSRDSPTAGAAGSVGHHGIASTPLITG